MTKLASFGLTREGVVMSYTMEDFTKDFVREHLYLLSPKERLKLDHQVFSSDNSNYKDCI